MATKHTMIKEAKFAADTNFKTKLAAVIPDAAE